jgi:hypothetical protein
LIKAKFPPHTFASARSYLLLEELCEKHEAKEEAGQALYAGLVASPGSASSGGDNSNSGGNRNKKGRRSGAPVLAPTPVAGTSDLAAATPAAALGAAVAALELVNSQLAVRVLLDIIRGLGLSKPGP